MHFAALARRERLGRRGCVLPVDVSRATRARRPILLDDGLAAAGKSSPRLAAGAPAISRSLARPGRIFATLPSSGVKVPSSRDLSPFDAFLDEVAEVAEDDPEEALGLLDEAGPDWHDSAEFHYLRGDIVWTLSGPAAAGPSFRRALELDPRFADAHHALAQVHEACDERELMVRHYLEVLRLDAHDDIGAGIGTLGDQRMIAAVADAVLEDLPEQFKGRLGNVPLVLEARPARYLVQDGFDPRALGLFEGPDHFNQRGVEAAGAPSRIVLYYANLLASYADEDELREQVEVTILHEIGHYFGLDEDDMQRLGLD